MRLKDIDPALALAGEFSKITKGAAGHVDRMREEAIFSEGALPARLKALAAMLWSISARCEPCIKYYLRRAARLGATEAEIGEILAIACAMGGCVGEMWAMKAFTAYKELVEGQTTEPDGPECCSAH